MRQITHVGITALLLASLLGTPSPVLAGGTIVGKVSFAGAVPPPERYVLASYPNTQYCSKHPLKTDEGRTRLFRTVEVSKEGGLKNALVYVHSLRDAAWVKSYGNTRVDIELCDFLPYTDVVVNGRNMHVVNHDGDPEDPKSAKGVLHTVRTYEILKPKSWPIFSVPLPTKGSELNKRVKLKMEKRGSVVRLVCDQHEWMQSWYLPVQNPYYAGVGEDGSFQIRDVPAGTHNVLAWHPAAGQIEREVEVVEGQTIHIKFEIGGK